ncbi:hypothetical protein Nmel_005635 [Mimus melanotis]
MVTSSENICYSSIFRRTVRSHLLCYAPSLNKRKQPGKSFCYQISIHTRDSAVIAGIGQEVQVSLLIFC